MIGWPRPTDSVRYFIDSLEEMGVAMSKYKLDHIAQGLMEINNNAHLWCIRGWTPYDLHREALKRAGSAPGPKPELVMGPGYQKAFENGDMDRDELIRSLEKMGFKVSMQ